MSYIQTIYNEEYRPYTSYPGQLIKYIFDRFNMQPGQKLIDIGCGRGDFLFNFKKLGMKVYGIDKEKYPSDLLNEIDIKLGSIDSLSSMFEPNIFDYVFCKSVIEHIQDPGILLKEIYRILKPNGLLIIMTPDWISNIKIFFDDYTHITPFTKTSLKDALNMFGFRNTETELFYQLPIIWKCPHLKILSWLIRKIVPIDIATTLNNNKIEKFVRWSCELQVLGYGRK